MRSRPKAFPALLLLLLATAPAGVRRAGAAEPAAAPPCEGINLEKIELGMTRAQVEALKLGKTEVLGQTSEETRLQVRMKKGNETIRVYLHQDRVVDIGLALYADKTGANARLTELKTHWGEAKKIDDPKQGRLAWTILTWSRRDCPAYGAYVFTGNIVAVELSVSANVIRDPTSDMPEIIK